VRLNGSHIAHTSTPCRPETPAEALPLCPDEGAGLQNSTASEDRLQPVDAEVCVLCICCCFEMFMLRTCCSVHQT
jgi:hypothetical protein